MGSSASLDFSGLMDSLDGLTYSRLEARLSDAGVNPVHAKPLFNRLHRKLLTGDLDEAETLPPPLRRWLASEEALPRCQLVPSAVTPSTDGYTHKYLLRLADGAEIESVLMGFPGRFTACLSTQVGCAMGCVFCATGQMGFSRHLRAGEIVGQAQYVARRLREMHGEPIRNIVLMGMGEPLHNFDPLMEALEILTDTRGLNIGPSRVAISTVGHVAGIYKLAEHPARYSLAVSLHGASDAERGALVPINQRWPLAALLEACRAYSERKRAKVFFAWTLIAGQNDSADHARRLGELLHGMNAHVNLIPLNPTEDFSGRPPDDASVRAFQQIVLDAGLPCTVRQRRGIDVAAGCGQLKSAGKRSSHGRNASCVR